MSTSDSPLIHEPTLQEIAPAAEERPEIVQGMLREGQISALGGTYGVGKSPLLQEILVCRVNGIAWCGRQVHEGTGILFDFENSIGTIRRNVANIARRYGVSVSETLERIDIYPEIDDPAKNPATAKLLNGLKSRSVDDRLALLEEALERRPDAMLVIDPPEMLFRINTREKTQVLWLYTQYRFLLSNYPRAVILNTFNLRKRDKRTANASLLLDARDWLEEICGSLDLLNRSDVRLGMDFAGEDTRVINGVRRGEDMHPLLVRPVFLEDDLKKPAGFEMVTAGDFQLSVAFTAKQREYWRKLPAEFTFDQAVALMGKANFSRLKDRALSLGVLEKVEKGRYRKRTV